MVVSQGSGVWTLAVSCSCRYAAVKCKAKGTHPVDFHPGPGSRLGSTAFSPGKGNSVHSSVGSATKEKARRDIGDHLVVCRSLLPHPNRDVR